MTKKKDLIKEIETLKEWKRQRDFFAMFYLHIPIMMNTSLQKTTRKEQDFILRYNLQLICNFFVNFLESQKCKSEPPSIENRDLFMKQWMPIVNEANKLIKERDVKLNNEKEDYFG